MSIQPSEEERSAWTEEVGGIWGEEEVLVKEL